MVFRVAALASPLLLGFVLPFVLALGRDRGWSLRWRAGSACVTAVGWVALLGLLWLFSGDRSSRILETACFLLSFGALLWGLFHLLIGFRLPPAVAQMVCSLVVVFLVGTVFYFDPIVERRPDRAQIALDINPYVVMAYSIFDEDLLTRRVLYSRTLLSDLQRAYPEWSNAALWNLLLGFWFHVGYLGLLALRLKLRGR